MVGAGAIGILDSDAMDRQTHFAHITHGKVGAKPRLGHSFYLGDGKVARHALSFLARFCRKPLLDARFRMESKVGFLEMEAADPAMLDNQLFATTRFNPVVDHIGIGVQDLCQLIAVE
jgi:hypothetical protein